jgi:class 3 adenylate cyclase
MAKAPEVPERIDALVHEWQARDPVEWSRDPARFGAFGRRALEMGSPGLAYDILSEAKAQFPADLSLQYLSALALANGGSRGHAARILHELPLGAGTPDLRAEALSLAGRLAKENWARMIDGPQRLAAGEQARARYREAFQLSGHYFPGINAATMCALTGQEDEARRIAAEIRALGKCGTGEDFWLSASVGEACLLLGDEAAAADWYRKAAAGATGRYGDIASMRRQVKLLLGRLDSAADVLRILAMPKVAMFSGHMIDGPGRSRARFPAHIEPFVAAEIAASIAKQGVGFGYCSAACGADILFAEQMQAAGAEVDIVLPFQRDDFVRTSVAFAGEQWVARFEAVMERAASVSYCVEENHLGDDVLFAHASDLTAGFAVLRAAQLETEAVLVAVAEADDERRLGGTASSVERWAAQGRPAAVIDLRRIRDSVAPARTVPAGPPSNVAAAARGLEGLPWGRRQIRTMLFADMVGYSRLREHETPRFFGHFLPAIEREMDASRHAPLFGNTWGDGLYLVFDEAAHGADFALRLRDAVARIDWRQAGLPAELALRVGMHTGPVFRARDPIIRRENYFGSHVTRAARIEPVAAPGSIYVSEQMAASLAASGEGRYVCDYLGSLALAKQYGSGRIYRLRRASELE